MPHSVTANSLDLGCQLGQLMIAWVIISLQTAQAQWPEESAGPSGRGIPSFRASWTSGERTTEHLAGWDTPITALELMGRPFESDQRSIRWLRSTRIVS